MLLESIPCVILSGGKSSRMKRDKSLLPFSQASLIEYQYTRLQKLFERVYISTKENKFNFEAKLIYDRHKEHSPMVALESIFQSLQNFEKIFVITVDTPLVQIKSIQKIIHCSNKSPITIAKTSKTHTLCGVYSPIEILPKVQALLSKNNHKIQRLLEMSKAHEVLFHDEQEFMNINTPSEYKKLLSI